MIEQLSREIDSAAQEAALDLDLDVSVVFYDVAQGILYDWRMRGPEHRETAEQYRQAQGWSR